MDDVWMDFLEKKNALPEGERRRVRAMYENERGSLKAGVLRFYRTYGRHPLQ